MSSYYVASSSQHNLICKCSFRGGYKYVLYDHVTSTSTSLFALFVMFFLFLHVQVVRKAAESSRERPPESHGEGGVRHAVWGLHDPERDQGQRHV